MTGKTSVAPNDFLMHNEILFNTTRSIERTQCKVKIIIIKLNKTTIKLDYSQA